MTLTKKELEILALKEEGLNNGQIARALRIALETVKYRLLRIKEKRSTPFATL